MDHKLNWAVLGTGVIANEMATALQNKGQKIYAVGNRTYEKGVAFAEKYGIKTVYPDMNDVFRDPEVDAVYLTTPHNTHYEFAKKALESGKHVYIEKAITLNSRELEDLCALAEEKGLLIAEAMTIWHMPLYKELWEIVESGELGNVRLITMNFGSFKEYDMKNRFFNMDLAGGDLLDIGVYAISLVRSFMSSCPDQVLSQWQPSPTGSDEMDTILLRNPDGQMATVALSMHAKQPKRAMISCEKGYIEIMEYPRGERAVIVDAETGATRTVESGETKNALQYELEDFEKAVLLLKASEQVVEESNDPDLGEVPAEVRMGALQKAYEQMKLPLTRDVMDIMTALRKEWGMKYPNEQW